MKPISKTLNLPSGAHTFLPLLGLILVFLLVIPCTVHAQKATYYLGYSEDKEGKDEGGELCDYIQQSSYTTDIEVEKAVDKILAPVGMPRNFVLVSCPTIKGARAATSEDGFRFIVYDMSFISGINKGSSTDWFALQILAHELGHHFLGHTLRPSRTLEEQRNNELAADNWSGFILYKLGASLEQAQMAIVAKASEGDDTYSTHPNKIKRLASLEQGYKSAMNLERPANVETKPSSEAFFNSGNVKYAAGDLNGAMLDYNKAVELNDNNAQIFYNRGQLKREMGDQQGAITDFTRSIMLKEHFGNAYNYRGQLYYNAGRYSECIQDMGNALEYMSESDPLTLYYRSLSYKQLGDFTKAYADMSNAILLDPQANFYLNRSVIATRMGNFEKAIQDCDKALELDPDLKLSYYNRGMNKFNLKDYNGAADDLKTWIQSSPKDAEAYLNVGLAYYYAGENQKAVAAFTEMIVKNINQSEAYYYRGVAQKAMYDTDAAIADYNAAIAQGYTKPEVYFARANALYLKNENDAALNDLSQAFSKGLSDGKAYQLRGHIHQRQGNLTAACADFSQACNMGVANACADVQNMCE